MVTIYLMTTAAGKYSKTSGKNYKNKELDSNEGSSKDWKGRLVTDEEAEDTSDGTSEEDECEEDSDASLDRQVKQRDHNEYNRNTRAAAKEAKEKDSKRLKANCRRPNTKESEQI